MAKRRKTTREKSTGQLANGLTFSRLTMTIIVANLIGLTILLLGSLGMTQYRDGLIAAKLEGIRGQSQVIADILAQIAADDQGCDGSQFDGTGPVTCKVTLREDAVNVFFSKVWDGFEGRVRIYKSPEDFNDLPLADAKALLLEDVVLRKDEFDISTLPDIEEPGFSLNDVFTDARKALLDLWPTGAFQKAAERRTLEQELTEAFQSSSGVQEGITSVRYNEEGELVASVSVPIQKVSAVYGVVTAEIGGIQDLVDEARVAILPFFILALVAAFLSSLLLTAQIAQPIRQLAIAADRVREGIAVAGRVRVPDFSHRADEIGELSASLRAMTQAIYARIEAIESFAADVSHELKNPLTSIRSAIETLSIAKSPEAQDKLMKVIQKDVVRMDRLITDISNASRVDAELARETREVVDLRQLLRDVVDIYQTTRKDGQAATKLFLPPEEVRLVLLGSPGTLGQVFRNLIDNAISFSQPDGEVRVSVEVDRVSDKDLTAIVTVDDDGPGIPPDNLESIFKRFYTERPAGTAFGNNSGLGLAISRQIAEAHGGTLTAQNRLNESGARVGARFVLRLPLRVVS